MKLTLLTSLLFAGIYVNAQPVITSDINVVGNSNPCWLTDYGNKILFFADNGANGNELFAYDTAATLQFDLNPGSANGASVTNHRRMAMIGKTVYFPGDDGTTGIELYKWSDSGAPMLVSDIRAGFNGSDVNEVVAFGGKIYFNANNGTHGNELWSHDPASGLTQRLTDLATGAVNSNPHDFVVYKDKLYFTAFSTTFGTELFVYNAATNTTTNALDISTGITSSDPQAITIINDKLYFSASTIDFGRELYTYDAKNLLRITNVDNAPGDGVLPVMSGQTGILDYKGILYFAGDNGITNTQLFQYNPANGVTSVVILLNQMGPGNPANFVTYAGKMFFSADDGNNGNELWMYNGKDDPTMVADLEPGANGSNPMNMLRFKTNLFLSAEVSGNGGRELYKMMDSAALGIQNIRFNANVTVYPNPANSIAHISMNLLNTETFAITLADATGKLVYNSGVQQYSAGAHTTDIPMSALAQGMYIYTLRSNTGTTLLSGRINKQ